MYHKVAPIPPSARYTGNYVLPDAFEEQLAALRQRNYESITFDRWLAYRAGRDSVPPRPLIITFDDGYRSFLNDAGPALERWGFTATVFLVAGLIGRTNSWDSEEVQEPLLSAEEILDLQARGSTFGSHTMTHAALTRIPLERASIELSDSRRALESVLGAPVTVLCYPYAKQDPSIRALARKAGYQAAVIGKGGTNTRRTEIYALRRIKVDTTTTIRRFRLLLVRGRIGFP